MKRLILFLTFFLISCSSNKADDPLIVPPNFNEIPDVNNPQKPSEEAKDVDIEKLKDLLLKSE